MKICGSCKVEKNESEFYDYHLTKRKTPTCKECVRARVGSRYKKLKESGLCNDCASPIESVGHSMCQQCRDRRKDHYREDIVNRRLDGKRKKERVKLAALNAYGGCKCACCGETHIEFLAIDHINNDGAEHRRSIVKGLGWKGSSTGIHMHQWLKNNGYPPGFQVLCHNCNFAKGHFDCCPHKRTSATHSSPALEPNHV